VNDLRARERIRSSLDETLIVEAAAGTGKTSELVRRIAAVLQSGRTTVDRTVAVTFTRKAAGELRLRLRLELDRARSLASDAGEIRNLEDALKRLEEARIGTIHSFCAEILRLRPVEARIAPGFEELDEVQAAALYNRAFDSWIETALADASPGLRRALSRISSVRGKEEGSPLDRLRTDGRNLVEWRDFPSKWRRQRFDRQSEIKSLHEHVSRFAEMVSTCTSTRNELRRSLQCVIDFTTRAERRDDDYREGMLLALAQELRSVRKGYNKKFSAEYSRDAIVDAKDRLQAAIETFERDSGADLAALLQEEMQGLVRAYEELKTRSGKLDFTDLLIHTRDLIRDNLRVRAFLQQQFTHIFVDEFQDTDPVQAEILMLLSAADASISDWRDARPSPGKLFLVGDAKQSIYRFRRADIIFYQDICGVLESKGAARIYLSQSFRSLRPIQQAVNAAFAPEMRGDSITGQPAYVALEEFAGASSLPAVIALPVPKPYGKLNVANYAIEASLPDATAAFVDWLLRESGWKVRDPERSGAPIPIESRHIALLFRRFMKNVDKDMTREYVRALENRNVPHLLWGSRSFHEREEVETLRAALNAIEWPDDELSVYATLRGALFAISDNLLLRYRTEVGPLRPFRPEPENVAPEFQPISGVLQLLADLHRRRNWRSAAETLHAFLETSRAHAAFALRPSGDQVLLNVYHVIDLARAYELHGGISFRGFVEDLNSKAEREGNTEPPVLEDAAEGVRIMTVHAAKGLEFPIVILADITAKIAQNKAGRYIDPVERLAAIRIAGCSPWELLDHQEHESARDEAEGVRVAYVAATRARDLLVVPAVGDGATAGWLSPLNKVIYPARGEFRNRAAAPACPAFGESTVLARPLEYDGPYEASVRPGLHRPERGEHEVVWWDPAILNLGVQHRPGLHYEDILAQDEPVRADESVRRYESWKASRAAALDKGSSRSMDVFIATEALADPAPGYADRIEIIQIARTAPRPSGARFGSLVHLVLRDAPLAAPREALHRLARTHARLLAATEEEIEAASAAVFDALQHDALARVRKSSRCHRELPISLRKDSGSIFEGVIDLAFQESGNWIVVDFKTDADRRDRQSRYRRQVAWYVYAMEKVTGTPASGCLLHV
jgi:ATP-dependent helicase/nuclease subunit A